MLKPGPELQAFERWYASEHSAQRTYEDAVAVLAALWVHARTLNPDFPPRWELDIQGDIELARVLNGRTSDS